MGPAETKEGRTGPAEMKETKEAEEGWTGPAEMKENWEHQTPMTCTYTI